MSPLIQEASSVHSVHSRTEEASWLSWNPHQETEISQFAYKSALRTFRRMCLCLSASLFICVQAILGRVIFGEAHAALWWMGISLTLCGLLVLHGSLPQTFPQEDGTKDKWCRLITRGQRLFLSHSHDNLWQHSCGATCLMWSAVKTADCFAQCSWWIQHHQSQGPIQAFLWTCTDLSLFCPHWESVGSIEIPLGRSQ